MTDPLLEFYNRELSFIRKEGREFARRNPKIAGRLRLSDEGNIEDPHVSRLIEAFALLCARLRLKIEDEFPEICHSMLQALYPQYMAPIPPLAICQLRLNDSALDSPLGYRVKRGARVESDPIDGVQCQFRVCYDTHLLPLVVSSVEYLEPPFPFELEKTWKNLAQAAIRIKLTGQSDKLALQTLQFDSLRLFLGGSVVLGNELYESFFRDAVGLLLCTNNRTAPIAVPRAAIEPVGFSESQCLLDHDPRTIQAYRLLWEFFALPEKFRFADLRLGDSWARAVGNENSIDVVVLLSRASSVLARELGNDTIRVGCTPVINLFEQRAEPFRHSETQSEYRIIPTSRKPQSMEVISINEVTASSPGGESQRVFRPFFCASHQSSEPEDELFWHSTRRTRLSEDSEGDRGTEVYITLVDLLSQPVDLSDWTVHVNTTCCNRDFVSKLFGSGKPKVSMSEAGGAINAEFLTAPTPTMRPLTHGSYYWRLISHLSLNHLSLTDSPKGAEALREILTLYNPADSDETKRAIQSLDSVSYKRSVARLNTGYGAGFCRGLDIEVVVDENCLVGMGAYMFATILDHFFSTFATINSFTRLTVRTIADQDPLMVGKPRAGDREWV